MKVTSPYLTVQEAFVYLRFPTAAAFYRWRSRHRPQLRGYRRGGMWLFKQADLDAALEQERPARPALRAVR